MRKRTTILLFLAGATLAVSLLWAGNNTRVKFGIGALPEEHLLATNATCFSATVTNKSRFAVRLDDIRFEWRDRAGRINGCAAFSQWTTRLNSGSAVVARTLIPVEAQELRVCVVCKYTEPLQKLVAKLPRGRYSWLDSFVLRNGLIKEPKLRSYFGPWMANSTADFRY